MRIFVDVGAHFGESILKALNPKYGFELVVAFEPSSLALARLNRIDSFRLRKLPFALGETNHSGILFGAGYLGASLYPDKEKLVMPQLTEEISIRSAAKELLPYLEPSNEVWLKINCEGGEVGIIKDLDRHNLLNRFEHIYIDWDARKVPSLRNSIQHCQKLLENSQCSYVNAHDFQETGWLGVEKWLTSTMEANNQIKESDQEFREYKLLRFPFSFFGFLRLKFPRLWGFMVMSLVKARGLFTR